MAYVSSGGGLDYLPCRYGKSKLMFRGPRRALDGQHLAVLGGAETYGKFVADPWPALVEAGLGRPVVNFGYMNAGIDVFVGEPTVIDACAGAVATVVQLTGVPNTSNRFYAVHPRRNDRFLRASPLMKTIFREIDFTEFNFTRHMLAALQARAPDKFSLLLDELGAAWVARVRLLLQRIDGRVLLLWIDPPAEEDPPGGHIDPFRMTEALARQVAPHAAGLVHVRPSAAAWAQGSEGMVFNALEAPQAAGMPGPAVHREIAAALLPALRDLIG